MNKNLLNVLRKRKCVANTFLKNRVETNWIYYNKQPRAFYGKTKTGCYRNSNQKDAVNTKTFRKSVKGFYVKCSKKSLVDENNIIKRRTLRFGLY